MIEQLNLPKAQLKLKRKADGVYVWCIVRKKELLCTPEEWVRQHFIHFLLNEKNIPLGLIASEVPLNYNGRNKRADIVVYDRLQKPFIIVECKATSVSLTESVMFQAAQYYKELKPYFIVLTNGLNHIYCGIDSTNGAIQYFEDLPNNLL